MLTRRQELNTQLERSFTPEQQLLMNVAARIDRWSLALDFKILLRTLPAVILDLGAK